MSCGCGNGGCLCNFEGGDGVDITGTGTRSNPYVIEAEGGQTAIDTLDTSSLVWTETGSGVTGDPITLSADVNVSLPVASSQVFTAGGSWTKPAGVGVVRVIVAGGGGGGAGGGMQASNAQSALIVALGGDGGAYQVREFAAADVPASVPITVGQGGAGGAGATVAGPGANGSPGTFSGFGALIASQGGAGGTSVTTASAIRTGASGAGVPGTTPGGGGPGGYATLGGSTPTLVRKNLSGNPSFESGNTTGWFPTSVTLSSVVSGTPAAKVGNRLMRVLGTNTGSYLPVRTHTFALPAGGIEADLWVVRNASAVWSPTESYIRCRLNWYNAAGTQIAITEGIFLDGAKVTTANAWYHLNMKVASYPSGAVTATVYVEGDPAVPYGTLIPATTGYYVDAVRIESLTTANAGGHTYFDGDTADTATVLHAWTGTVQGSTSTETTYTGLTTFTAGGNGAGVPLTGANGGTGGAGGGTATSQTTATNGTVGGASTASTLTTRSAGGGAGGGGAGKVAAAGGAAGNGTGGGGGGGASSITPVVGAVGGRGGNGFVAVIAW